MDVEKTDDRGIGRRLLRCHVCTRTDERTATELLDYCQSTWPRCCGEVMSYFVLSDPDDTTPDVQLPP